MHLKIAYLLIFSLPTISFNLFLSFPIFSSFVRLFIYVQIQQLNKSLNMRLLILMLLVLGIAAGESFQVSWLCGRCTSGALGTNCYTFDGGPFSIFETSIDNQYSSCGATGLVFPRFYGFFCNHTDKCSQDCNIVYGSLFQYTTYCPVGDSDTEITFLNSMYQRASGTATYNWCEAAGCANKTSNTVLIIVIVAGVVVIAGIIIGIVCYRRKKAAQAAENYNPVA